MYDRQPPNPYTGYGKPRPVRTPQELILRSVNWEIVVGFLVVFGFCVFLLLQDNEALVAPGTIGLVLVGWVFSLCLHEFAHAATAVLGGDTSIPTLRYLSFNPLRYVNLFFSIILPIFFILLGGIALPGGAVYINTGLLRSRGWQSAVSLAGPLMNLLMVLGCALALHVGFVTSHPALAGALALLAYFELFVTILNLVPIPPLDGFGALMPWLPPEIARAAYSIGQYGVLIIFALLWFVPPIGAAFQSLVENLMFALGISVLDIITGIRDFFFWQY